MRCHALAASTAQASTAPASRLVLSPSHVSVSLTRYSGWDDYAARNGIVCRPGTYVQGQDGLMYVCQ
jgi:hypothetical protein